MPDLQLSILFFVVFILILAESIYYLNKHSHEAPENSPEIEQPKGTLLLRIILPILVIAVIAGLILFFWKKGTVEKTVSTVSPSPTLFLRPTATPITIAQNIIPTILPTTNITPTNTPVPTKTPVPTRTPTKVTVTPSLTTVPTVATSSAETVIQPKLPVAGFFDQTLILIGTGILTLVLGIIF